MFNKVTTSLLIAALGFLTASAAEAHNGFRSQCGSFMGHQVCHQQQVFCGNHNFCGNNFQTFGCHQQNNFQQLNNFQQVRFIQHANFNGFNNGQAINARQACVKTW